MFSVSNSNEGDERLLEKKISRAANLLHAAHLRFNEITWARPVERIEIGTDHLVEVLGYTIPSRWFSDFPHNLVATDDQARRALLTHLRCDQAFAYLHILVNKLLQGSVFPRKPT